MTPRGIGTSSASGPATGGDGAKYWLRFFTKLKHRIRKAVRARGYFPNEQAALKCVYMALMSLDPTGKGRRRWMMRWKAPLNAFEGRLAAALKQPTTADQPFI